MAGSQKSIREQAAALANRLRLIQVDFAESPAESRCQHLQDEIATTVGELDPSHRSELLDALEGYFPTWDRNVRVEAQHEHVAGEQDHHELQDPTFLVDRLVELAPELDDRQKRTMAAALIRTGLVEEGTVQWPEAALTVLRESLGLPDDAEIDPERLLEMLVMATDVLRRLDMVVKETWKHVSPRATIRNRPPIHQSITRYVTGDRRVDQTTMSSDLEFFRTLAASLVSVPAMLGKDFFGLFIAKALPHRIEDQVQGSLLKGRDAECWRAYRRLAGEWSEAVIDHKIREIVQQRVMEIANLSKL